MPLELIFRANAPWALLPTSRETHADVLESENEPGWLIRSPIEVEMQPTVIAEVSVPFSARPEFSKATGLTVPWQIGQDYFVWSKTVPWLEQNEAEFHGQRKTLFHPIGMGHYEWRLGFSVLLPTESFLLLAPAVENRGFEIVFGLLNQEAMAKLEETGGLSIVIRPTRRTTLHRGDPVARLHLIGRDVLAVKARVVAYTGDEREGR
jgi:hypothetical protein